MTKNLTGKVGENNAFGAFAHHIESRWFERRHQHRELESRLWRRRRLVERPYHDTGDLLGPDGSKLHDGVQRTGTGKASRSEEEIALVFDRNKGAIYSIYTRALRDKPDLQGKLVLELTISPQGEITQAAKWSRAS